MEGSNGDRRIGFDANARAAKRESGAILIGDKTYHPARVTNKRLREVRALARRAGIDARRAAKDSPEYQEAYDYAIESGETEEEAKRIAEDAGQGAEAVSDINAESLKMQLPVLLRDENMQAPSPEIIEHHLDEDLDARDVSDLMSYLLGGEDPTPTPTEGTSTTTP